MNVLTPFPNNQLSAFAAKLSRAACVRKEAVIQSMVDKHLYPNCPADGEILFMLMQAMGISLVVEHWRVGSSLSVRQGGNEIDRVTL